MAENVNANIRVDLDTSQALASLRNLQAQISAFNQSVIKSNATAVAAQQSMVSTLTAQIGATKQFTTSMVNVEGSVSKLGRAIDKNKLGLGEYFRYGVASSKNFGRIFGREHTAIMELAADRVKRLQTQYIALGEAQNGMTRAMAVRPMNLFNADAAIAIQRQQLFNKLLTDGSTSLINFGKNTQWAGRQLMVGFTVPLTIFGGMAGKIFMDLEKQVVKFRRVYGDATTPLEETNGMIEQIQELAKEFTKYGIAVSDTVGLAGDAAAAGAQGADLIAATAQSTRLSTLGMIDQQQALTATIALQSAFRMNTEELANSVNFLNAVENQTVVSLADITEAIPKVAPVIQGLGGDVQDLAIFMAAMREGGVNAAEGANALKSGLASLINPTKNAREQLAKVGIDIDAILSKNKGDIRATVSAFGEALGTLDKFSRQQTLAKVFGKYQFARLGALFENINRDGSQAQRVVDLTSMSMSELGTLAEKELSAIEESVGTKFTAAMEKLRLAIAPIGEVFLKVATPIIEGVTKIFDKFNELSPAVKNFAAILVAGLGVVVPTVIMLIGLFANFAGNALKGFALMNNFFNRIRGGAGTLTYLTEEQLDATAAAVSLEGQTTSLTTALNIQRGAVNQLARAYRRYTAAAQATTANMPQAVRQVSQTFARGGRVLGSGNSDNQPALLTPGEFVMNRQATERFGPILDAMNRGTVKGFEDGSRMASTQFGAFSTQSTRSARAVEKYLSTLVNLSESDTAIVVSELQKLQNEQKLTKANLMEVLKNVITPMPKMAGAHLTTRGDISERGVEFLESRQGRVAGSKSITAQSILALAHDPETAQYVKEYSGLYAKLTQDLNNQLKNGAVASRFFEEWGQEGNRLLPSLQKYGGLVIDNANDLQALSDFEEELARNIGGRSEVIQSGKVTDAILEEETRFLINQYKNAGGSLGKVAAAADQASQTIVQVGVAMSRAEAEILADQIVTSGNEKRYMRGGAVLGRLSDEGTWRPERVGRLGLEAGQSTIRGLEKGTRSQSESREAQRVANDTVDGFVNQIERRLPEAKVAGEKLAGSTVGGMASRTSDIRKLLKEKLGVGPLVEEEQANLRENIKLRQAENREIERRMMLLQSRGASPLGLRERAVTELQREKAAATPLPVVPEGAKMLPIVSQDLANETKAATGAMSKIKVAAGKFGSTLIRGSMKMQGALFALDGLVFAASMMDNSIGNMAQQILPFVFALQGVTMVLPMLKGAIPLLLTPIGAAAAALAAVGIAGFLLKKGMDNTITAGKEMAKSMTIAKDEINSMAEYFGNTPRNLGPDQPLSEIQGLTPESIQQGREFAQSEYGQKFVEGARMSFERSASDFSRNLATQLSVAVINNAITPEQANAIAVGVAEALGQEELTADIIGHIALILDPQGNDITSSPLQIMAQITANIEADEASLKAAAQKAAAEFDSNIFGTDNFLNLGALYSGEYDEMIRTSITYYDALIANSSTMLNVAENELAIQDQKIKRLEEQAKKQKDATKRAALEEQLQQERDRRALLVAQQKETMDKRRQQAVDYISSKTGAELNALDNAVKQSIEAQAPGLDATAASFRARGALGARRGLTGQTPLTFQETTKAVYALEFDIQVGNIDALSYKIVNDLIAEGGAPGEAAGKTLGVVFDLQTKGDVTSANEILTLFGSMSEKQQIEFSIIVNNPNNSPQEVIAYGNFLKQLPDDLPSEIRTEIVAAAKGMSVDELNTYTTVLGNLGGLPEVLSKIINVQSLGADKLLELTRAYSTFEKKKNAKKQAQVAFGTTDPEAIAKNLDAMGMSLQEFAKQPSSFKMAIMAAANVDLTPPPGMAPDRIAGWLAEQRRGLMALTSETLATAPTTDNGVGDKPPVEPKGGSKEKSYLEQLIEEIDANAKLFLTASDSTKKLLSERGKFFGILQQLRDQGIPEQLVSSIGVGPDALKKAQELGKLTKAQINQYSKNIIGAGAEEARLLNLATQRDLRVEKKTANLPKDVQEIIMSNDALKSAFDVAKKGTPLYRELLAIVKQLAAGKKDLANATITEEEAQKQALDAVLNSLQIQMDTIENDLYNAFEKTYGMSVEMMRHEISQRNFQIQQIQRQISAIEELNNIDQERIESLNRQKEMIQRQIEALERANELDQRQVETLRRQDELRSREADAISYDLEIMSQQEEKIRNQYKERIDALNKVKTVNDQIIQQQRQQLGLSQAISEGDIYAATAAAQEMRAGSAQFAAQQTEAGLQQGMENAVGGLLTSGGLTREQAELRLQQIKQQSYQTSLLIRDIEDRIYARNQEMIPLKDQQYQIDLQIRDIGDIIYERTQQIKQIQTEQIDPLTRQNELQQNMLDILEYEINEKTGPIKAKYDAMRRQETLNNSIFTQTANIRDMTDKARGMADLLATSWGNVAAAAWNAANAIAAASAAKATEAFAGGIIGYRKGGIVSGMQGFYGGGVAGSGARDSVAAMLSPGEFVVRKAMVDKYGKPMFEAINQGSFNMPSYNVAEGMAGEVEVKNVSNVSNINAPVYNTYDMKFNISGANASPDDIANRVMFKMKQVQDQAIRGNRGY